MVAVKFHFNNEIRRVTVDNFGFTLAQLQELARNLYGNALPKEFSFKYKDDENDLITVSSDQELSEAVRLAANQSILRIFIEAKPSAQTQNQEPEFMKVLEKLLVENPFVKSLIDNFEVEVKSIPTSFAQPFNVKIDVETPNMPAPNAGVPLTPIRPVHYATCDSCNQTVVGIRYKCHQCPDYDLCEKCEPQKLTVHDAAHTFEKITHPIHFRRCGRFNASANANSNSNSNRCHRKNWEPKCTRDIPDSEFVHPAVCDGCQNRIKGLRHKCSTCPDFDLCNTCFEQKLHSEHKFSLIERPRCPRRVPEEKKVEETVPAPVETPAETKVEEPVVTPTPVMQKPESPVVTPKAEVQTPAAVPVPIPTPAPISPFEAKLNQLEEMGFGDKQKNIALLVKYKGDMLQAVRCLLEN